MLSKHFKPDPRLRPRLHWGFWVLTGLLAIACPTVHNWQQRREARRQAEYGQLRTESDERVRKQLAPVYARQHASIRMQQALGGWRNRHNSRPVDAIAACASLFIQEPTGPTRAEVEARLYESRPLETTPVTRDLQSVWVGAGLGRYDMAAYTPPDGDPPIHLYFNGNTLVYAEEAGLPEFRPPWGPLACRFIREQWKEWGPWLWALVLPLPFILRRHRIWLAEVLTALAFLLTIAALPGFELRGGFPWGSLAHDTDVAWAMFKLSTSAAVLVWAMLWKLDLCRVLCPLCGYNLRGNISGLCPECGTEIPPDTRQRLAGVARAALPPTA